VSSNAHHDWVDHRGILSHTDWKSVLGRMTISRSRILAVLTPSIDTQVPGEVQYGVSRPGDLPVRIATAYIQT
jgi:hypothetical protein